MKKNFTSITMFEIYRRAWNDLMADWSREYERKEHAKQLGKPHELSDRRLAKYDEQMLEISEAMNELEAPMKVAGHRQVTIMVTVTLGIEWTDAYSHFLDDHGVSFLATMDRQDETVTFTLSAEDEAKTCGKWSPSDYAQYVF